MARSSIDRLPAAIKAEVKRLIGEGATIDDIVTALQSLGKPVSRTAVGRYTKRFREVSARMKEAREIAEAFGAELKGLAEAKTGRLLNDMLHTIVFRVLMAASEAETDNPLNAQEIMMLARSLKETQQAITIDADREIKIRDDEKKQAVERMEKTARAKGLTADTITAIKAAILGVEANA